MNKRRYLYHSTPSENVESILREGLIRGGHIKRGFAISLSQDPLQWWRPGMTILSVDIVNLIGEWSDFLPESDEILFWGDIPPERIKVCFPHPRDRTIFATSRKW